MNGLLLYSTTSVRSAAPLDEITVLSLTETEQSSSCDAFSDVSSVCSADNDEEHKPSRGSASHACQPPRSIFSSYWSSTCRINLKPLPQIVSTDGNDKDSSVNFYERALNDFEQSEPERLRRFQHCMSLPELARASLPVPMTTRTALSASVLQTRMTPESCLRHRRTNQDLNGKQVSVSTSVRFNDTVEIIEFTPLAATRAPNGWSTYFY